jgi:hypothetical protein
MRRVVVSTVLSALMVAPTVATAKLPFFGLDVHPLRPGVGQPITLTMTCFDDAEHTRPWGTCMGAGAWGRMAWIHPLDDEGDLDRSDWIPVVGHSTTRGATRGRVVLDEPGAYDVLPLWRTWGPGHSPGMPSVTRIEVGERPRPVPMALAALGIVGAAAAIGCSRRQATRITR